jgi:uncharacterized protein (TIGR02246 family)
MNKYLLASAAVAVTMIVMPAHAKSAKTMKCAVVTQAQVNGLFDDFNKAWATNDPAKVTALFTKDAVLLPTVSNKPRTTPAEINDYFIGFLKGKPVGVIDTSTYKMNCDSLARLGTWTVTLTDAATGAKNNVKARYSFIYRMEDGKWKIDHLHSSMMPEKPINAPV